MLRAAVIILSWNGATHLPACLAALEAQRDAAADIVVVDNGSYDGSAALARQLCPRAQVVENGQNLGFAAGMNIGLRALRRRPDPPEIAVLLNQDTVVAPDWLAQIAAPFAAAEQVGAVGCKIYYPDGRTIQHAGGVLDPARATSRHLGHRELDEGQHDVPREVEYVTGAAIALRMAALEQVGPLDEGYSPAYYEDNDLCWRLRRAGYAVLYQPAAMLRHVESTSIGDVVRRSALMHRNRLRFVVKSFEARRIWEEFLPAERAYMAEFVHGVAVRALRRAYLAGMLNAGEWVIARRRYYAVAEDEARRLVGICGELRRAMSECDRARAYP